MWNLLLPLRAVLYISVLECLYQLVIICDGQLTECDHGKYGKDCSYVCGKCADSQDCNKINGSCEKCVPGKKLPLCTQDCDDGKYGIDCYYSCGQCLDSQACNKINGSCEKCVPGKRLPLCDKACDSGKYGDDCKYSCGPCADSQICNKIDGSCPKCVPGKKLPDCKIDCDSGFYGENCSQNCGQCLNDGPCNATTGLCKQCQPGFQPPLCQKECEKGKYGQDCLEDCGQCAGKAVCHVATGHCSSCTSELQPPLCKTACINGTYGSDCSKQCGQCKDGQPCNVTTGECIGGCQPGWTNKTCDQAVSRDSENDGRIDGIVIAVTSIIISVVIIIIAVIAFKVRRLQKQSDIIPVFNVPIEDCTRTAINNTAAGRPYILVPPQGKTSHMTNEHGKNDTRERQGNIVGNSKQPPKVTNEHSKNDNRERQRNIVGDSKQPPKVTNEHSKNDNRERQRNIVGDSKQPPKVTNESASDVGKTQSSNENVCVNARKEMPVGEEIHGLDDEHDDDFNDTTYFNIEPVSIPVSSLQTYLLKALNTKTMEMEFLKLPPKMIHSHDNGLRAENRYKNQFNSILPYDSTRVVLDKLPNDDASDYINANYIRGHKAKIYIAAQGPKNNTVNDFWRMVWQERVQHIVMLTNVLENTKPMCHEYWPGKRVKRMYGQIEVRGLSKQKRAKYVIRAFGVRNVDSQEKRRVQQFHYVSWFDHDVPRAVDLVDFWRFVKSQASKNSPLPLLVHCSAGVGRTGTYIALDIIMDHAEHEKEVNIFGIVRRMRDDRCGMVQNKKQYAFLHKVVLEAYTSRNTRFDLAYFNKCFSRPINSRSKNKLMDTEYEKLKQMQVGLPTPACTTATQEENRLKNRNPNVLPADKHLVSLPPYIKGRNQYINAVYVSTFVDPRGCILTQLPLPDTRIDIWRLIDGCGATLVVSIKNLHDKEEEVCRYWPSKEGETITNEIYTLTTKSQIQLGTSLIMYNVVLQNQEKTREVRILTYTNWDKEIPANTPELLQIIETLQSHSSTENNPVIIQCKDGASKSGLLCALWEIISRMNHTHDIDVYLTVRKIQSVRRQAVNSVVQYRYCYEMLQQYRDKNIHSVYANT